MSTNFSFSPLALPEVVLIEARSFPDRRGYLMENYRRSQFLAAGIVDEFVQDNLSYSTRGVIRGLHYQLSAAPQSKLVSAVSGEIFDVAVDLRRGSPTFGHWVGARLSAENRCSLLVPWGFAHGFQVLSDDALVAYKLGHEYSPERERGVNWSDPEIGIDWPLRDPLVSEKDAGLPPLRLAETDYEYVPALRQR